MGLRSKLIRLAHAKPELREHLLPLLKEAASGLDLYKANKIVGKLNGAGIDASVEPDHSGPSTGGKTVTAIVLAHSQLEQAYRTVPALRKLHRGNLGAGGVVLY